MTECYLKRLVEGSAQGCGVVPQNDSFFEGLCAVYPTSLLPMVQALLDARRLSLRHLLGRGMKNQGLRALEVTPAERALFENWNTPEDAAPQ
jgi:molybdopterin-guanine dinucleotide biosynthesis protein A